MSGCRANVGLADLSSSQEPLATIHRSPILIVGVVGFFGMCDAEPKSRLLNAFHSKPNKPMLQTHRQAKPPEEDARGKGFGFRGFGFRD